MTPEGWVKKQIKEFLNSHPEKPFWMNIIGGNPMQRGGVPDMLICYRGRFIAVEAKRADGKGRLSEAQKVVIAEILHAGGYAFVAKTVDDVKNCFDEIRQLTQL